ncbi:MAG: nucleotidyltransferase family protein [Chlamydiae bacterium]|nr:nucleotidyltransferase family protein [Chlamydiota bacterium]
MLLRTAMKILYQHKEEILRQGARELSIFGSVARNENRSKSDVDILVDFDAKKGLFAFVGLKQYLEAILSCEVDLVSKRALHPALKSRILQEAKNVF